MKIVIDAQMKNLKLINTFSRDHHHEMYNSSLLYMCRCLTNSLLIYSDRKTYENYLKLSAIGVPVDNNVICEHIYVHKGESKHALLLRYLISSIQNVRILLNSRNDDLLIYLFNNAFSLHLIYLVNKIKKRKIIICCHGELELLKTNFDNYGILAKMLRVFIRFFFADRTKVISNIKFIVIGDSIYKNLTEYININLFDIEVLDHPYFFQEHRNKIISVSTVVSLGTVGTLSENKGGRDLIKIANALPANLIKMSVIGKCYLNEKDLLKSNIHLPCKQYEFCPRYIYDSLIIKLDYILFLYPVDSYKLTASGAIYDAISHEIPIISLRNDYFQYLFDKYGAFGYLLDDVDSMIILIKDIINNQIKQKFDFERIKSQISPQSLSLVFRDIVERI